MDTKISPQDFSSALDQVSFWDPSRLELPADNPAVIYDCMLQNREEVAALCQWIAKHTISSYLEIGVWTGQLINTLHKIFHFKLAAACDLGEARALGLEINLANDIKSFEGNVRSPIFRNWRAKLGHIDLTFIDTDHTYDNVRDEFEIATGFPHTYVALHGISGSKMVGEGVKQFWQELKGKKVEILLPFADSPLEETGMGIGIWQA